MGEIRKKGVQIYGGQMKAYGRMWLFACLKNWLLLLAGVMCVAPVEAGWGYEALSLSVPMERVFHGNFRERGVAVNEGLNWAPYQYRVEQQGPATSAPSHSSGRTKQSLVNTVMALLATFDDAGVLPAEGTVQANQIIHALIQLQSALVKSTNPDLRQFVFEALREKAGDGPDEVSGTLLAEGLTSRVVEALVTSAVQPGVWERPALVRAFQEFNVTEADWRVVETIFLHAREAYAIQGRSIHEAFSAWQHRIS